VGALFNAHQLGLAAHIVPPPGLLLERASGFEDFDLAVDLESQRASHAGDRV
jgi:hypothetical protein